MDSHWSPPPYSMPPSLKLHRSLSQRIYEEVCSKWMAVSSARLDAERVAAGPYAQLLFSPRFAVIGSFVVLNTQTGALRVLSIGTGTKWTRECHRKRDIGEDLVDSHAEIIARRALVALLFEMVQYCKQYGHVVSDANDWCLLQKVDKNHYRLKPNLQLYLYVNIPPCENKGPGEDEVDQYGNPRDDYTNASSCSVKMSKWAICGVQGALLSQYIEPIYLSGLVVSDGWGVNYRNFNEQEDFILMGIYSRIGAYAQIHDPAMRARGYRAQDPKVGRYLPHDSIFFHGLFSRGALNTQRSHNWFDSPTGRQIELTHQTEGMVLHRGNKMVRDESRLSKRRFAIRYLQLGDIINVRQQYKALKGQCTMFNEAKSLINYPLEEQSDYSFSAGANSRGFNSFSRNSGSGPGSGSGSGSGRGGSGGEARR